MTSNDPKNAKTSERKQNAARPEFLKKCGWFAIVTPPVTALPFSGTSTKALA